MAFSVLAIAICAAQFLLSELDDVSTPCCSLFSFVRARRTGLGFSGWCFPFNNCYRFCDGSAPFCYRNHAPTQRHTSDSIGFKCHASAAHPLSSAAFHSKRFQTNRKENDCERRLHRLPQRCLIALSSPSSCRRLLLPSVLTSQSGISKSCRVSGVPWLVPWSARGSVSAGVCAIQHHEGIHKATACARSVSSQLSRCGPGPHLPAAALLESLQDLSFRLLPQSSCPG